MDHHCPYMHQCIGDRNFKSGPPRSACRHFAPRQKTMASLCETRCANRTVLTTYLVRFHILACWGCLCMIIMWNYCQPGLYLRSAAHRACADLSIVLSAAGWLFTLFLGSQHLLCAACGRTLIEMSRIRQLRSAQMVRPSCDGVQPIAYRRFPSIAHNLRHMLHGPNETHDFGWFQWWNPYSDHVEGPAAALPGLAALAGSRIGGCEKSV